MNYPFDVSSIEAKKMHDEIYRHVRRKVELMTPPKWVALRDLSQKFSKKIKRRWPDTNLEEFLSARPDLFSISFWFDWKTGEERHNRLMVAPVRTESQDEVSNPPESSEGLTDAQLPDVWE